MSDGEITTEIIEYDIAGSPCRGFAAYPAGRSEAPLVLVAHAWAGQLEFEREQAKRLARLGYVGFAIDLFGGKTGSSVEENQALIKPFTDDRTKIRDGMATSLKVATALDRADASKRAAIGFCFGGMCVLDLARAGTDVAGVVSFHGLLFPSGLEKKKIPAKVLALHGNDDPMVPPDLVAGFYEEMDEAEADWQCHVYGGTKHAFTNPQANDHELGTVHDATAAKRAFATMEIFLRETLG